jgi:uncharacterized protein YecE (DUF72 family)
MGMDRKRIHIGTSGWSYNHWGKGVFYPPELRPEDWLAFYARHFHTVEINNSFYHLPKRETFEKWRDAVPDGFTFAVKVSRFVTHMKKLSDPALSMTKFLENASALGRKLGPLLFQLPPFWKKNVGRLEDLLLYLDGQSLVVNPVCVFEFRNGTWLSDDVFEVLHRYGAHLCLSDWPELSVEDPHGAATIYLRRHGPGVRYASGYTDTMLKRDAKRIWQWAEEGKEIYGYFNNDAEGWAVRDAKRLARLVAK